VDQSVGWCSSMCLMILMLTGEKAVKQEQMTQYNSVLCLLVVFCVLHYCNFVGHFCSYSSREVWGRKWPWPSLRYYPRFCLKEWRNMAAALRADVWTGHKNGVLLPWPWHSILSHDTWVMLISPSGYYMHRQFNIQQFYVLPTQCIYVFCVDLRTNSDYFTVQH
jgi:hypothetical protein